MEERFQQVICPTTLAASENERNPTRPMPRSHNNDMNRSYKAMRETRAMEASELKTMNMCRISGREASQVWMAII